MPRYYFRVTHGRYSGPQEQTFEASDDTAAWRELTTFCRDLIGDACRELKENSKWQIELLDETKKPLFRIFLAGESLA
jgi:hypothetical protein